MSTVFRNTEYTNQLFRILDELIYQPMRKPGTTGRGLTITGDHPSRRYKTYNCQRNAVLRVPYGLRDPVTNLIPTYGVGTGSFTVGTSPR